MKYQAIQNKVLIKPDTKQPEKKNGIFLPATAQEKSPIGVVISVGPEVTSVKVGDRVLFARWDMLAEVKIDGETHLFFEDKPEHLKALVLSRDS